MFGLTICDVCHKRIWGIPCAIRDDPLNRHFHESCLHKGWK